jgi:integrase
MNPRDTMLSKVRDYLADRRQAGFALTIAGKQLQSFAHFADCSGYRGPITVELASGWALANRRGLTLTNARRIEVLRSFARYSKAFDTKTEIPPVRLFGPGHRRLTPHIYTEQEFGALLAASAQLCPADGLRPVTCSTIFGLLSTAGLRISEATALRRQDVDLKHGILHIRQTKFGKSRFVPLHPSATRALQRYVRQRDREPSSTATDFFFVFDHGQPARTASSSTPSGVCAVSFAGAPAADIASPVFMTYNTHSPVDVCSAGTKRARISVGLKAENQRVRERLVNDVFRQRSPPIFVPTLLREFERLGA